MSDSIDWKTYDDVIYSAATNRLPATDALVGKTLTILSQHGPKLELTFEAPDRVSWISGASRVARMSRRMFHCLRAESAA